MIDIHDAGPEDAGAISELIGSLLHYRSPEPAGPPPAGFIEQFRPEVLAQHLATPEYRYAVAYEDGRLVGVIGVRGGTHLLHLFVPESHHRRGIARALWERARAGLLAQAPVVQLTVRSSIYAVEVYRRFGFEPVGPRVDGPISFVPMQVTLTR